MPTLKREFRELSAARKLFETRLLNREELSVATAVLFTTDLLCAIAGLREVQKASTVRERYYCNVIYWFLSRVIVVLPRAIGVQFTQGFTVSGWRKERNKCDFRCPAIFHRNHVCLMWMMYLPLHLRHTINDTGIVGVKNNLWFERDPRK